MPRSTLGLAKSSLEILQSYVLSRNGTCSDKVWHGRRFKYTITCDANHTWKANFDGLVLQKQWCKICYILNSATRTRSLEETKEYKRKISLKCAQKPEQRARAKARYEKNKDTPEFKRKSYSSRIKRQFGISFDEFGDILISQCGTCGLCQIQFEKEDIITVDHCHETGIVRGIVHRQCNSALGMFKDSYELLLKAVKYLEKFNAT